MTLAPAGLKSARLLLLTHLDIHEHNSAYPTDLDPAEVGIVGDTAHVSEGDSYHLGTPEQSTKGSYSVLASPRDKAGLCAYASAIDIGMWSLRVAGKTHDLRSMSLWFVAQCKAGAPDTADIREIIYSPDGKVVRRWDRLGHSTTGDSSHLGHTHISLFRDATKAGRGLVPLITRYLTSIGLIEGDDMPTVDDFFNHKLHDVKTGKDYTFGDIIAWMKKDWERYINSPLGAQLTTLNAQLAQLAGRDPVDEEAVVRGVLAGLGARPSAEVAAALVAAGQDPAALAAELSRLAG